MLVDPCAIALLVPAQKTDQKRLTWTFNQIKQMHFCPAHTHSLSLSLHEPKPKRKPQIPNPKHNSPSPVAFPAAVMTRPSLTNVSLWVNLPYPVVVKALRLSNRRRVLCIGVQRNKSIFFQCCSGSMLFISS